MTYANVQACVADFPVARVCEVLEMSVSGYYAWLKREPSQREQSNQTLKAQILVIWETFKHCYGVPRIHAELQDRGGSVGKTRVARLMKSLGIRGKGGQKRRPRTTQADKTHPRSANILNRDFEATQPNSVWLTNITYIETYEGFLYLAGVMDLYSRQIVGLTMAEHMRSELTETALEMALCHRQPDSSLMHHSDRGSQYTCASYQQMLTDRGITVSMSRTENCLDNAPMESFWATLKRECADRIFDSHQHARSEIFGYIMGFYNRVRRHSALDYLSPNDYEIQFLRQTCTPSN
jgi:putative transposase